MKLQPNIKKQIAQKLRTLREEHGLTQAELGQQIGRATTTVASWESGKGQPDADTLLRLMALYRVEDVVGEFGYRDAEDGTISRRERALVNLFRAMDEPARGLLFSVAQELSRLAVAERQENAAPLLAVARSKQPMGEFSVDAALADSLPDEGWSAGDR
jgi:transcriptional regulator with XRE-family HTH domain